MRSLLQAVSDRLEEGHVGNALSELKTSLRAYSGADGVYQRLDKAADDLIGRWQAGADGDDRSQLVGAVLALAEEVEIITKSNDKGLTPASLPRRDLSDAPLPQVFLSYARRSGLHVDALVTWLTDCGYGVWFDKHIEGGGRYPSIINAQIDASMAAVVIWCKHAVRSDWVRYEAARAHSQDKLIPLRLKSLPLYEIPAPYPATLNVLDFGDEVALLATLNKRGIFPMSRGA